MMAFRVTVALFCFWYFLRKSYVLTTKVSDGDCLEWMLLSVPHILVILVWVFAEVEGCLGLLLWCLVFIPMPFSVHIVNSKIRAKREEEEKENDRWIIKFK